MTQTTDTYDYEAELDDNEDTLSFGKYKDLTPAQLASTEKGREYIIWAHNRTHHWVGSEFLVRKVHEIQKLPYIARAARPIRTAVPPPTDSSGDVVAACEAATLEAFGCFPKPRWAY